MPDLTRETLAELRRLREAIGQNESAMLAAMSRGDFPSMAKCRRRWRRSITAYRAGLHFHAEALLAAAERGLGAGDGR